MKRLLCILLTVAPIAGASTKSPRIVFKKPKLVVQDDGKDKELKARVIFTEDDRLLVTDRKGREVWADIPFADVKGLTYERSKHPRAKTAIFISPIALFSKGKKHWLTVTFAKGDRTDFILLRLDKKEQQRMLVVAETRIGVEVERIIE